MWDAQRQRTRKLPWQPEPMADWSDPIPVSREGWCLLDRRAVRLGDEIRFTAARLPDGVSFAGWAGDRVCFTMPATDRGPAALWSVRLPEGAGLTRITPAPGDGSWSARVSAGGKWIAWRRNAPDTVLLVVQLFGGEVAARFEGLRVYLRDCWSPDGRFLWCHDTRQLHIISLADEATERMVEAPEGWHFLGPPVHWSLDGSRLAVMCARDDGGEETPHVAVFVAHADGDGLHRIAEGRIALPWLDLRLAGWTEDGRVVIVQDRRAIVAIDPDTGEREVVLRATAMADHRGTETQRTARELQRH